MEEIRGYKVFNRDWTCRGFKFEVGSIYEEDCKPKCCEKGFHFCLNAADCFSYYDFDPNNNVAEVVALGDVDYNEEDSKACTNKIKIVRKIPWSEVLEKVNIGNGCTGLRNSGDCNSGDCNSGDWNSGDWNSGYRNSGHYNSGDCNSGYRNSGNYNNGNRNSGYRNSGNCNSGNYNSGDWNSGYRNSGHYNSGNYNNGNRNSGYRNSGNCNSGNYNSGDCNSGNRNIGNCNSGDWNSTNYSNGCFNTSETVIYLFNKPSKWTYRDWLNSEARAILNRCPCSSLEWIYTNNMTDEEREAHPEHKTTGGFLRTVSANRQEWWDKLSEEDKNIIKNIPNFDGKIFKKITGIDVERRIKENGKEYSSK